MMALVKSFLEALNPNITFFPIADIEHEMVGNFKILNDIPNYSRIDHEKKRPFFYEIEEQEKNGKELAKELNDFYKNEMKVELQSVRQPDNAPFYCEEFNAEGIYILSTIGCSFFENKHKRQISIACVEVMKTAEKEQG